MGVRMSNCGHDENNRYSGGKAGDQTGTEWCLRSWYPYPWNYILRWKDEELANLYADLAVEAAQNNNVGYDQGQRTTFGVELQKVGWRPSKIKTPCEADCSKGTIDLIRAVGHIKGIAELQNCHNVMSYTGNMMTWFRSAAGKKYFEILTGKYLTSPSLAKRGDINLNTSHHVNITVDNGANAGSEKGYLEKGDSGSAVKTMQTMLIACGYSCGASGADGDFGSGTDSGLRAFQKANGLTVDGKYGPKSKAKLEGLYKKHTTTEINAPSTGGTLNRTPKWVGKVTASSLNVRTWAGKENGNIKSWPSLEKGNLVDVCDSVKAKDGSLWYYIRIDGRIYGFVHSRYIVRA